MNIEINKRLIKEVFPNSRFIQLRKPTISETVIGAKPGDWVWMDGKQTYCRQGIDSLLFNFRSSEKAEAAWHVFMHLNQLNNKTEGVRINGERQE